MNQLKKVLSEYETAHCHPLNQMIHRICVPLIVVSLLGLLRSIPGPIDFSLVLIALGLYYCATLRNWKLFAAIGVFLGLSWYGLTFAHKPFFPSLVIFVLAWIGQFVGHHIEGKQPAFFESIISLFVGPLWVMSDVLGIERVNKN